LKKPASGAERAARIEFERDFWRKRNAFINKGKRKFFHKDLRVKKWPETRAFFVGFAQP